MDSMIKKLLWETVTHKHYLSEDSYGDKQFADPIDYPCYPYGTVGIIKTLSGEDVRPSQQLYISGAPEIDPHDEFTFRGITYPLLNYQRYKGLIDPEGLTVVYL